MFFVLYSDDGNIFHNPFLFYFQIAIGGCLSHTISDRGETS